MNSFTVFVCSTYSDLSQERDAVLEAIRRLQLQHDSMEYFGARSDRPIETCLEEVRSSDVLVVILGHRYGSLVPGLGTSYSEAEYNEGFRLKKPCLVYVRNDDTPVLPKNVERDPEKMRLLEDWKANLQSRHTVAMFRDENSLALQVAADLSRTIRDIEETTKARAAARNENGNALIPDVIKAVEEALKEGVSESSLLSAVRSSLTSLMITRRKSEPTVFLSYAHKDAQIVSMAIEKFGSVGIRVWDDDYLRGEAGMRGLERELTAADFLLFFISPEAVQSELVMREVKVALLRQVSGEGGAVVLPILLRDADFPPLLKSYQFIDMRDGNLEQGLQKLIDSILHHPSARQGW